MTTVTDYAGFLTWLLGNAGVSDDAKRIAGTDYAQCERIEQTFSNMDKPSRVLAPLLTANFAGIDPALPAIAAGNAR
ncbi:MAG: hypothetical protein PSV26_07525 [Polaromonas sp.]|uniref:hypothetical protein n=1 Tax=Polaromonas sp. TaxID=1869339 RepID=UPI002486F15B|nr:hypothetical protein [Polaromonas sp.]MDI1237316.1 hypothetical protein [Polaromonas sp.]